MFTKEDLLSVLGGKTNYLDGDERVVKFYNDIAVIQNKDTKEIVSIVTRNKPKEGWKTL